MGAIETNPPEYIDIPPTDVVAFLAGPIQGAPDWQQQAVTYIDLQTEEDIFVANPRTDDYRTYDLQVDWEQRHLWRAKQLGGILFWLACEAEDAPAPNEADRAYGQTTRVEFGKITGWLDYQSDIIIAIGMDEAYRGSHKYYRHEAQKYKVDVQDTLEETVDYLLERIEEQYGAV